MKLRGLVGLLASWGVACGGAGAERPAPTHCAPSDAGVTNCGASCEPCATSLEVTGGTFYRGDDGVTYTDTSDPATVSSFYLDKYEVTVGRFRAFATEVVGGWRPPPGSGKHTQLNGGSGLVNGATKLPDAGPATFESGWDSNWNSLFATTLDTWTSNLSCYPPTPAWQTWTASAGDNESKPINCVTWQEAYAFCIWDGGFLPSEAEWNYAAEGGGGSSGQRAYPWSAPSTHTAIDCLHASYAGCPTVAPNNVGSESPAGDGRYGQADLAGNVEEWNLDWYASSYVTPCVDCANLTVASGRVLRGGGFDDPASNLLASWRLDVDPGFPDAGMAAFRDAGIGVRCARAPSGTD